MILGYGKKFELFIVILFTRPNIIKEYSLMIELVFKIMDFFRFYDKIDFV